MPTSTLNTATSLARSRSAASLSRKSSRHRAFPGGVHAGAHGARKRLTSPTPAAAQLAVRRRRQSNVIPHRRAASPSPVPVGVRGVRHQSPNAVLVREARHRKSPLPRSHSTGSIARTTSMLHVRATPSASSVASKRAQKKARAAAARRLARSKSANSIARKRAIAAANAKSISSARTRSQYHIKPMALGGEPTTGPIGARPTGGVGGLFRRKADKHPVFRGGLGGLFGKKSPPPAVTIAPSPAVPKRSAPTIGGGDAGPDKALVPRPAQTMALVPRNNAVVARRAGSQALVPRRAGGRQLTLAERKQAMALATRNANTRRLRTVRYGAAGANGSMMMKRAVMATGGGIRVGPINGGFPGVNGTSKGSLGERSVLLDGDDIGSYGEVMPMGFEGVKMAILHYTMKGVEVCAIADEMTVMEWEEASSAEMADVIGQLRMKELLLVPPGGSDYKRFLLKIAEEFDMDIVSNNQFELEQELEEDPGDLMFLETKLVPYMFVKKVFIPHPEEGRIISGLHGPRPMDPMLLTGSGGGTMGAFNAGAMKQLPGRSGGVGNGNGALMGLPRGAKAIEPLRLRSERVAAVRAASAATRNRKAYQSRMRTIAQQQQLAQRRRQVTQMQKLAQQPPILRLTR